MNQKAIKARISSVKNTKKITKAMEMVSAAKMRKAIDAAIGTRTYATLARELMERLSQVDEPNIPLIQKRPTKNLLVVLVSSNRGLCGSFNANVFKKTRDVLENIKDVASHANNEQGVIEPESDVQVSILGIGRKSAAFAKKYGYDVLGVYDELPEKIHIEDILPIAKQLTTGFAEGAFDKVVVAYTDFYSSIQQVPHVRPLLPVSVEALEKIDKTIGKTDYTPEQAPISPDDTSIETYLFEPDVETILSELLPRLVEVQLFQAMLESAASEHSSRMIAMKNASDAAGDMIKELTLASNKARQAAITQEIAEISSGAAALS